MALTDTECRNAKCPIDRSRLRLADGLGLYLEVLPAGGKYWRLKYRHAGKEKRLGLGVYPSVKLGAARKARDEARTLLAAGQDPSFARKEAKAAQAVSAATSFETVARAWHQQWKSARTDHHNAYVLRRLEADVFPVVGSLPIVDISAHRLVAMAKKIEARGALDIAKRVLQTCGQIMRYAVAHGVIDRNPAADVKPGDVLKSRRKENYARVDANELPELLRKMQVYGGTPHARQALQLIALTFVRTSELIEATWSEFDLDAAEWRIPKERMKMRCEPLQSLEAQVWTALHRTSSRRATRVA